MCLYGLLPDSGITTKNLSAKLRFLFLDDICMPTFRSVATHLGVATVQRRHLSTNRSPLVTCGRFDDTWRQAYKLRRDKEDKSRYEWNGPEALAKLLVRRESLRSQYVTAKFKAASGGNGTATFCLTDAVNMRHAQPFDVDVIHETFPVGRFSGMVEVVWDSDIKEDEEMGTLTSASTAAMMNAGLNPTQMAAQLQVISAVPSNQLNCSGSREIFLIFAERPVLLLQPRCLTHVACRRATGRRWVAA
jgi:hypothetical protein